MCMHEYEYESTGLFGTGHSSPLQHVTSRSRRPLGLLAAWGRSDMPKKKRSKQAGKAAAAAKLAKKQKPAGKKK